MKSIFTTATLALAAFFFASPSGALAAPMTYHIRVNVENAPNAPGSFAENQWTFGPLPGSFYGTFDADDTVTGSIGNLQLVIGGVNFVASHTHSGSSSFNPLTMSLTYMTQSSSSAVVFGPLSGAPANYAAGVQAGPLGPMDPYLGVTQNWTGTFELSTTPFATPEPGTWMLLLAGGSVLAMRQRIR